MYEPKFDNISFIIGDIFISSDGATWLKLEFVKMFWDNLSILNLWTTDRCKKGHTKSLSGGWIYIIHINVKQGMLNVTSIRIRKLFSYASHPIGLKLITPKWNTAVLYPFAREINLKEILYWYYIDYIIVLLIKLTSEPPGTVKILNK